MSHRNVRTGTRHPMNSAYYFCTSRNRLIALPGAKSSRSKHWRTSISASFPMYRRDRRLPQAADSTPAGGDDSAIRTETLLRRRASNP